MNQQALVDRLAAADPGWPEWADLIGLVESLSLSLVENEYFGSVLTSGQADPDIAPEVGGGRLTFRAKRRESVFPDWVPSYVPALDGLIAADYTLAGGYAGRFGGHLTDPGHAFVGGVPDEQLGFPVLSVPPGCHPFQENSHGALFHLNSDCQVLYPDLRRKQFSILDSLEVFTRTNIRQALAGRLWFDAYHSLDADLFD